MVVHRIPSIVILLAALAACVPQGDRADETATDAVETTSSGSTTTVEPATTSTTGSDPDDPSSTTSGPGTTGTSTTLDPSSSGEDSSSTGEEPPPSICGDGVIEGDELCDEGEANADDQACTSSCTPAECGDGVVWDGHEECDLGVDNDNLGACTKSCIKARCGDGLTQSGVEECDEGEGNNASKYGGCIPLTCKLGPHCGDGTPQLDHEECDDADPDLNETFASCTACSWESKIVFVTSGHHNGDLGGLAGADSLCQGAAKDAGLDNSPSFKAWLSDGTHSPSNRMTKSEVAYALISGKRVAGSWAALVSGQIENPINIDENNTPIDVNDALVWTSTTTTGVLPPAGTHCSNWSSGTWSSTARVGNATKTDKAWTDEGAKECDFFARLYCVEQ